MTMSRATHVLAFFGALAALGCGDSLAPQLVIAADAAFNVDIYADPFVQISIRNVSGRSIQLAACDGTDILPIREQLVDGRWVDAPLATCVKEFAPITVSGGETVFTGSWNLSRSHGTYRFRAPLYFDSMTVRSSREASSQFTIP
jgi:hypothetical protein